MGYRRFTDRQGHTWEVRERTRSEWELEPVADNPNARRSIPAPGYEADPFELNEAELQRLVDDADRGRRRHPPSPFGD